MIRSKTRTGYISRAFGSTSAGEKGMRVQMARLAILYEDFKIEYEGAQAEHIDCLDGTGKETRRFYFVRQTLRTVFEIRGAIQALNGNSDFETAKTWWKKENVKAWNQTVTFFSTNHKFLKDWRNDLGGHFHETAAAYAIDNIDPSIAGLIEVHRRGNGADVRMKFAYDLVAVAMTKNRNPAKTEEEFLKEAFTFLLNTMKHTVDAVQIIVAELLFDKFK